MQQLKQAMWTAGYTHFTVRQSTHTEHEQIIEVDEHLPRDGGWTPLWVVLHKLERDGRLRICGGNGHQGLVRTVDWLECGDYAADALPAPEEE